MSAGEKREQVAVHPQTSQPCDCGSEVAGVIYLIWTNGDASRLWIERCDECQLYDDDQEAAEALVEAGIIPDFSLARTVGCKSFTPYATDDAGNPLRANTESVE